MPIGPRGGSRPWLASAPRRERPRDPSIDSGWTYAADHGRGTHRAPRRLASSAPRRECSSSATVRSISSTRVVAPSPFPRSRSLRRGTRNDDLSLQTEVSHLLCSSPCSSRPAHRAGMSGRVPRPRPAKERGTTDLISGPCSTRVGTTGMASATWRPAATHRDGHRLLWRSPAARTMHITQPARSSLDHAARQQSGQTPAAPRSAPRACTTTAPASRGSGAVAATASSLGRPSRRCARAVCT